MLEDFQDMIYEAGVCEYGFVDPTQMEYHQTIRDICKGNTCGQYGCSWACPPAVGTIEECKERCIRYDTMMVFSGLYFMDGAFDVDAMERGMKEFKQVARNLEKTLGSLVGEHLMLSNEGCGICNECTYPHMPCRFPEQLHHSIEGYGFMVSDLAKQAKIEYNNGLGTMTYFGALLFNQNQVTYPTLKEGVK